MRKIEVFLHYARASDVVKALGDVGYRNITLQDFKGTLMRWHVSGQGCSIDSGRVLISEVRLTLVCEDAEVEAVTAVIRAAGRIRSHPSAWMSVSPVEEAPPLRPSGHNHL